MTPADQGGSVAEYATFASPFKLPECPRWHDGSLWATDMWGHTVRRFDADGTPEVMLILGDDEPAGLGWLPDGALLVVSMEARRLLRVAEDGSTTVHADLTEVAPWACNDMIVRADGTAYVSHFGFDYFGGTTPFASASVIRVTPDGQADVVADDLVVPNGMALGPDDATLTVAEPGASRLTRFTVEPDGSLTGRRTFAELEPVEGQTVAPPDGICLDAEGAVWMAEPIGRRVLRVLDGGEVTDELGFEQVPLAVCLGGDDRRTLFVCLAETIDRSRNHEPAAGRIAAHPVAVPGAGRP